ncbi:MAG: translocation/assembly module TamB domain-containing protein [Candidatus Neomarinimicrobiota bacterium]
MKSLIKIILLMLIPLLGIFILSYPGVWKYRAENILNRKILRNSGWDLSIGELSGHLFKQVKSKNIEITHENGTTIYIPELNAQFNVVQSLVGNLYLKELNISDFYYQQTNQNSTEKKVFVLPDLNYKNFPLIIDKISFDGILQAVLGDSTHLINLDILSAIQPNESGLNIYLDSLFIKHHDIDHPFILNDTKINIVNRIINVNPINGSLADVLIDGDMTFLQSEDQQLKGNLNVKNIIIPEKLFEKTPLHLKFSVINANFQFDTDFQNYSGIATVNNDLGLNMQGDFNITKMDDSWLVNQFILQGDDARLFVHGDFIDNREINADFDLKQLDLSNWLTQQKPTNISGIAKINTIIDSGYVKSIALNLETQESALFEDDTIFVNGAFVYENNQINIAEPFTVSVGPSSITSVGQVNFTEKEVDLKLSLNDADVFIINNFWNDSLDGGMVSGNIEASGKFNDPKIIGTLAGENIAYKDFFLAEMHVEGVREQIGESLGSAQLKFGNGKWKNIEFENGEMDVEFFNKETRFTNVNIINGNEFLAGSGVLDDKNSLRIDDIKTFYKDHYFVNKTPFNLSYKGKIFSISTFAASLDDGDIEGEIAYNKRLKGNINFSNIDAKLLHPLIKNNRYRFTGQMFGKINFDDSSENQNYAFELSVKNGAFAKEPFDQLKASMELNDNILNIKELVLQEDMNSYIDVTGKIPFGEASKTEKIQLESKYQNINIKTITQFLPDWYAMSGIVNGELIIDGTGKNMKNNFNVTVYDAAFDKISLGTIRSRGFYDGNNLNFHSYSSDLNNDHFTGNGYLPIDLNIRSGIFGHFRGNDSLKIFVEGKSTNLNFITNYFDEVDKAPGEYLLALELTGIWDNIIRNGRINANNASIYTPLLDDPIKEMHGFVKIENNQLSIDNMQGKMYRTRKRSSAREENISLSGGMDMTNFFDPYLNINANGQDAYFRSLLYEIEGIADFDVSVTGRDTMLISGEVAPIDVEMFQQLTTSELGVLPSEENSKIIHYKIDFPIKGKFTLANDQLEAVFIGDVSINQFGDREMDFAGELTIEEGKFYYYGDIFTITDGYLTFDNHGFNPYLDVSANLIIDGERIDISIVGLIDNPNLTFTSASGFSQSDILELLTWRKKFEEQDLTSTEISTQATDIAISWFGSQLDRNIIELSGLNRIGILEKVDVRGLITAGKDFSISAPISGNVSINYAYRRSIGVLDSYHSLGVELRLNRNLSLVGNIDRSGYMHIKYRLRYAY